jgi:NCS1 family nucleobase:cation symporter-1
MISDYYLVRGRELLVEDLYRRGGAYEYRAGFNPKAMIALACGVGVALIGLRCQPCAGFTTMRGLSALWFLAGCTSC